MKSKVLIPLAILAVGLSGYFILNNYKSGPNEPGQPKTRQVEKISEKVGKSEAVNTQVLPAKGRVAAVNEPKEVEEKTAHVLKTFKPTRKVIRHPDFGMIAELTYENGSKRYEPTGPGEADD